MTPKKTIIKLNCLLALLFITSNVQAQIIYGTNNYTQYHKGTLPIIISAPHGGLVAPANIPDRTCNNPTNALDSKTIELTRQIDTALFNLTGCHPHLIICNLRRTKLDCNRDIADGACGNVDAMNAWTDFHNFIDSAQYIAQNQFGQGKVLYIDLHGHGKQPHRLELGYNLSSNAYNQTDALLNTATYLNASSIKNLVGTNVSGSTHAQLLRGSNALGTYFANAGFPAVPSQQSPNTNGFPYFTGGYNTSNYTCVAANNTVNGLQIECDSTVRFSYLDRKRFADSTAAILVKYLLVHQNIDLKTNCGLPIPTLQAKVNLSNFNLSNNLMDIFSTPNFPLTEPFRSLPLSNHFTHVNNSSIASTTASVLNSIGTNGIVDWVFLELRKGTAGATTVAYTKAALLQCDGDIVDTDGNSAVGFTNAPLGAYYVTVRHRNHLGFRTLTAQTFGTLPLSLNFTNNSITLNGNTPLLNVGTNLNKMLGGDSNNDGSIDAFDAIVWESQNGLFDDYNFLSDYNLDGSIDAFDTIVWELNNGKFEELD